MGKYQPTIDTFNNVAEQYWRKFGDFELYQSTYDWFLAHLPDGPSDLLELGCGPGNVSQYLLNIKPELNILGIDLAPNMIELAKKYNPRARYKIIDCRNMASLPGPFDAIMCGFCLPYLTANDCLKLLDLMADKLSNQGLLYISITENNQAETQCIKSQSAAGSIQIYYHDAKQISHNLKNKGFNILGIKNINHIYNEQVTEDVFILARKANS